MQLLAGMVDAGRGMARDPDAAAELYLKFYRLGQLTCRHILIDQRGSPAKLDDRPKYQ